MKKFLLISVTGIVLLILASNYLSRYKQTSGPISSNTNNAPAWLKDLIEKEEGGKVANLPESISKCIYGGQTVYYLPPRCCDIPSTVYNDQGNVICSPDGGFTGKGDGKCTNFFDTRKNCAVIWKNSQSK